MGYALETAVVWWGDNGREPIPLPKTIATEASSKGKSYRWEVSKDSIGYKIASLMASIDDLSIEKILLQTPIKITE